MMREGRRFERFLLLPFSFGCHSPAVVALADSGGVRLTPGSEKTTKEKGEGIFKMKKNKGLLEASFFQSLGRFMRQIKNLSHYIVDKREEELTDMEMEIGYPTDVKHVSHMGLDGSTATMKPMITNWENRQLLSFPHAISLHNFELAMTAQSQPSTEALFCAVF